MRNPYRRGMTLERSASAQWRKEQGTVASLLRGKPTTIGAVTTEFTTAERESLPEYVTPWVHLDGGEVGLMLGYFHLDGGIPVRRGRHDKGVCVGFFGLDGKPWGTVEAGTATLEFKEYDPEFLESNDGFRMAVDMLRVALNAAPVPRWVS